MNAKRIGGLRISHERLKKEIGINEDVWITGIEYQATYDTFVIHVRGNESVTFLGQESPLWSTAEGSPTCHLSFEEEWKK